MKVRKKIEEALYKKHKSKMFQMIEFIKRKPLGGIRRILVAMREPRKIKQTRVVMGTLQIK